MSKWRTKSGYEIIQLLAGRSNVFLLTNGDRNVLIDTSVSRNWKKLQRALDRRHISNLDALILTHAHFDHVANASRIKSRYNTYVVVQKLEAPYLQKGEMKIPGGTVFFTRMLMQLIVWLTGIIKITYEPCEQDVLVDSVYDFKGIGFNAYLMHTPGHTPGSMSLVVDDEIAIVGDAMFGVFRHSVFPPYAEDADLMVKSWGKLLETGCHSFLPA
ncbi:MAG: MBL fold metallo-hydrolase, partial [Bacteroidales bacterium]|nr:MBL fold metallo-hydrolase [Bacteroidales bacterium]